MAKHTPTPWKADCFLVSARSVDRFGSDRDVEICHTGGGRRPSEEAEANASRIVACVNACRWLIDPSAVPDMLAALEGAMRIEALWAPDGNEEPEHAEECQALAAMRQSFIAAIAKAKGESVE